MTAWRYWSALYFLLCAHLPHGQESVAPHAMGSIPSLLSTLHGGNRVQCGDANRRDCHRPPFLGRLRFSGTGYNLLAFSLAPSTTVARPTLLPRNIPKLSGRMKKGALAIIGGIAALVQTTDAAYVWPSQYDEIEDILSLQTGYRSRGFVEGQQRPPAIGLTASVRHPLS